MDNVHKECVVAEHAVCSAPSSSLPLCTLPRLTQLRFEFRNSHELIDRMPSLSLPFPLPLSALCLQLAVICKQQQQQQPLLIAAEQYQLAIL